MEYHKLVWQSGGHVNPVIIQNGVFKGLWKITGNKKEKLSFKIYWVDDKLNRKSIIEECEKIAYFLSKKVSSIIFDKINI